MTGSPFVKNSGGLAIGVGDSKYPQLKLTVLLQCLKTRKVDLI